jgi:ferritin-like metal-binding protein YciE
VRSRLFNRDVLIECDVHRVGRGLRDALNKRLDETRGHVDRLEQAFEALELKATVKHCSGMEGILDEGRALLEQDGADAVLDAAFIAGWNTTKSRHMDRWWRGPRVWATPKP